MIAEPSHFRLPFLRILGLLFLMTPLLLSTGGCSVSSIPGANLTATSLAEDPTSLRLRLDHGCYAEQSAETSFFLSDTPLSDLTRGNLRDAVILHAQLLWNPKPGSTPVDPTATNVVLRLVLLTDGELGIYGGAGFGWPRGEPGKTAMSLELVGSTLTLLHSTEGFRDLLSPFVMLGYARAPFKPVETLRFRQSASQLVTDLLGETQWVRDASPVPVPQWTRASTLIQTESRGPASGNQHSFR
ncbi:MAG: hypothetical protein VX641_01450 [Planctomycetota bacterium]|nr:hypothetical protein [Planctomycetota bacterium]